MTQVTIAVNQDCLERITWLLYDSSPDGKIFTTRLVFNDEVLAWCQEFGLEVVLNDHPQTASPAVYWTPDRLAEWCADPFHNKYGRILHLCQANNPMFVFSLTFQNITDATFFRLMWGV